MKTFKRFAAALGALLVAASAWSQAPAYPGKAVHMIVPIPAGGLVDILARNIGQELSAKWKQPVVVENRPGANTIIGASALLKAEPDGHTLLFTNPATVAINPFLYKKLSYQAADFVPVYNIAFAPVLAVVPSSVPANTLAEFVALAKAKPKEYAYGSYGLGSAAHFDVELFADRAGISLTHVPYKGIAEVLPALASGNVHLGFPGIPPAMGLLKQGRIKALAVSSEKRSPLLPDVPTFAEAGYGGLDVGGWFGLFARKGTPPAVIDRIAADLEQIFSNPEVRARIITKAGLDPMLQGPAEFAAFVEKERAKYARIAKTINVTLD